MLAQNINPYTCSSHDRLLQEKDIDAVVITLPRRLTYNVVKDSLIAGKHVFTEKPVCLNSSNGMELIDLAIRNKKTVQVGYMKVHDSATAKLKAILKDYPDPQMIRAFCHMGDSYASPFGDFKGSICDKIAYPLESFSPFVTEEYSWAFEQYINVFSHITHFVENVFDAEISIDAVTTDPIGQGFCIGKVSSIPHEASRGSQNEWIEGLS